MNQNEFLLKKYIENVEKSEERNKAFYQNPSTMRIEPFKIADNLYYVGDKKVCIHLIDSGDGLILIDSGYPGAAHLLVDSIWRAGFDPQNVKWIIHTHGHYDHFGASDEFKNMYGTKLAISKVDAESLRQKPHRGLINKDVYPYAVNPDFDYEIEDGEIFRLGNVEIRCVLTPGHTDGVLSLFFDVTDNGKTYPAGLFGGAGINTLSLDAICYNETTTECIEKMLDSIEKMRCETVVVHLGNHPANNHTLEKREQQLKSGGNPFIDPESWHIFLDGVKTNVEKVIKYNEEEMKKWI